MNILGPTRYPRLNEAAAIVYLLAAFLVLLSLASYRYQDPSWDTLTGAHAQNLIGPIGATIADFAFQLLGFAAYAIPILMLALAWEWLFSRSMAPPWAKAIGPIRLLLSL